MAQMIQHIYHMKRHLFKIRQHMAIYNLDIEINKDLPTKL